RLYVDRPGLAGRGARGRAGRLDRALGGRRRRRPADGLVFRAAAAARRRVLGFRLHWSAAHGIRRRLEVEARVADGQADDRERFAGAIGAAGFYPAVNPWVNSPLL